MASPSQINIVVGALCEPGPLLSAFGIDESRRSNDPSVELARAFLQAVAGGGDLARTEPGESKTVRDLEDLLPDVERELAGLDLTGLASWIESLDVPPDRSEAAERFWEVFAPDSAGVLGDWDGAVAALRDRRLLDLRAQPDHQIRADEILFTSNALLTAGPGGAPDEQRYFYDHPTPFGAGPSQSEIVYGLRGLDAAIAFERERGTLGRGDRGTCILSVSVTHDSLRTGAADEVRRSISEAGPLENLEVFAFTERETRKLVEEVLAPAAACDPGELFVFGVDGSYGRHYSFLKAMAPLWQVARDSRVSATFKIDLDQVFPQQQLVAETGQSALELLASPRWGSTGFDSNGRAVELGMIAGALVNQADIDRGLFTSDVPRPDTPPALPQLFFRKSVTQALSTEAEMLDNGRDGTARQRVHVTGGTTGITVDALRRHRPFTPSFISRAEDQAYLFSVLGDSEPELRTLHIPGLIMRHDKADFAAEALSQAAIGRIVGDYERTILFTGYARAIAPADTSWLGPFTGSYINPAPLAVTLIRLMLDVIHRADRGEQADAHDLLTEGVRRVAKAYELALAPGNRLAGLVEAERRSWDRYYEAINAVEQRPDLQTEVDRIIETARVA